MTREIAPLDLRAVDEIYLYLIMYASMGLLLPHHVRLLSIIFTSSCTYSIDYLYLIIYVFYGVSFLPIMYVF